MTIPDHIREEGVAKMKVNAQFYKVYVHQNGLFNSGIPGASPTAWFTESRKIKVTHQIIHMLDYDGKPCNKSDEGEYRHDKCRYDYIIKVCLYLI